LRISSNVSFIILPPYYGNPQLIRAGETVPH
jgi:hypothetical protein